MIYGASEEERETWEDTEERVIHIVSQTGIKLKNSDIERAHRVGTSGENRPIVCKFLAYKTKEIVLRESKHLRGTGISIREDYSDKVRRERQFLTRHMMSARKQGCHAYIRFDKLFVNGRVRSREELVEIDRKSRVWEGNQRQPGCSPSRSDSSEGGREAGGTARPDDRRKKKTAPADCKESDVSSGGVRE